MMLGYILARSGIRVTVLEKHKDFFRDFRGDTVHPSTLAVLDELGIIDDFLRLPHQQVTSVRAQFGDEGFQLADLGGVKTRYPFIVLMPQWDFLNFLSERAKEFPGFDLRMEHEAVNLLREGERVDGVLVRNPGGTEEVRASLVVACDGRHSLMRAAANLPLKEIGVPIDVLWFRISRRSDDPVQQVVGNINYGRVLVLIDRGDYFQAGLIIRKGGFDEIRQDGLASFRALLTRIAPFLESRVEELKDWDQVKLLSVQINRLRRWDQPGLLCIGDAAHAMSPAFGVGINLAIQDAVAAARILAETLKAGGNPDSLLGEVQMRREFPTKATQFLQGVAHRGLEYVFRQEGPMRPPRPMKVITQIPGIQRAVARVVGVGIRPEHIDRPVTTRVAAEMRVRKVVAFCVGVTVAFMFARRAFRR
jgi:2-polyprenyl-6-methoxyphenol hydroxylase-like FAD-dependent oxidoreductase